MTTRGIRNNNPGNIDRVAGVRWQGAAEDQSGDSRFVVFKSPEYGIRAIARVLITYQDKRQAKDGSKIDTIAEIIDRWAPTNENDTSAYVKHVASITGMSANGMIDVYRHEVMFKLVKAIITHENGTQPYSDDTINQGLRLAGIEVPPKPLAQSPTVIAATTGVVASASAMTVALAAQPVLEQAAATLGPLAGVYPQVSILTALITLASSIITAVRRYRDAKAGIK